MPPLRKALNVSGHCKKTTPQIKRARKMKDKVQEIIDGFTIKYHANGKTIWSKGKIVDGKPEGYWEWYRIDGTIKRSGHFEKGESIGEWTTYDLEGKVYKVTKK